MFTSNQLVKMEDLNLHSASTSHNVAQTTGFESDAAAKAKMASQSQLLPINEFDDNNNRNNALPKKEAGPSRHFSREASFRMRRVAFGHKSVREYDDRLPAGHMMRDENFANEIKVSLDRRWASLQKVSSCSALLPRAPRRDLSESPQSRRPTRRASLDPCTPTMATQTVITPKTTSIDTAPASSPSSRLTLSPLSSGSFSQKTDSQSMRMVAIPRRLPSLIYPELRVRERMRRLRSCMNEFTFSDDEEDSCEPIMDNEVEDGSEESEMVDDVVLCFDLRN